MSFLPVARSSATLDYFYALNAQDPDYLIGDDRTEIVAMDLGLKDTLFNEYLIEDAIYLVLALTFISLAILVFELLLKRCLRIEVDVIYIIKHTV